MSGKGSSVTEMRQHIWQLWLDNWEAEDIAAHFDVPIAVVEHVIAQARAVRGDGDESTNQ